MESKTNNRETAGWILFYIGFLAIILNALDYTLGWLKFHPILFILGIAFIAMGQIMKWKSRNEPMKVEKKVEDKKKPEVEKKEEKEIKGIVGEEESHKDEELKTNKQEVTKATEEVKEEKPVEKKAIKKKVVKKKVSKKKK